MHLAHLSDVSVESLRSPSGRYQVERLLLSQHLGAPKDAPPSQGGHPFEVEVCRIPPGAINWPLHQHSTQWEFFIVQAGEGVVETVDGRTPIRQGHFFMQPPHQAHHILNTGSEDLELLIVANNSEADVTYYPNSGRWFIKPQRKMFKMQEASHFYEWEDGDEAEG
ncbi:MAG: cupin [Puniceicoccaceae bacterium 5H]|nr:MAG: cupin [Puniceicoccaceae bacterium 5H]